jgi:hypothetical protein
MQADKRSRFILMLPRDVATSRTVLFFEAHWDTETETWRLLLEDLTETHYIATTWPLPPTMEQCAKMVERRARFHAAWWDDPGSAYRWGMCQT